MGLFEKLKNGLKNTKEALASKITGVINSFTKIDEDFFEELEETLILSDIGCDKRKYLRGFKKRGKGYRYYRPCGSEGAVKEDNRRDT